VNVYVNWKRGIIKWTDLFKYLDIYLNLTFNKFSKLISRMCAKSMVLLIVCLQICNIVKLSLLSRAFFSFDVCSRISISVNVNYK